MSDQKKDGGPAFPGFPNTQQGRFPRDGMTLRDWFAGQALAGIMVTVPDMLMESHGNIARACYRVADMMIAEREQQK